MILLLYQLSYAAPAWASGEEGERGTLGLAARGVKRAGHPCARGRRPLRSRPAAAPGIAALPGDPATAAARQPAALRSASAACSAARASSSGRMRKMRDSSLRSSPSVSRCLIVPR